jgi:hypothetical protein
MVSLDPNVAIRVRSPSDQNLILELPGPQARLQEVSAKLRGGLLPQGLEDRSPDLAGEESRARLDALSLVRNQKIFVDNGVTVLGCQPARTGRHRRFDRRARGEDREAAQREEPRRDVRSAGGRNSRPLSMLTAAENRTTGSCSSGRTCARGHRAPPGHYDKDVALRRPPGLDDERITVSGPATSRPASTSARPTRRS